MQHLDFLTGTRGAGTVAHLKDQLPQGSAVNDKEV
jgi:hypothetical protein